MRSFAKGTLRNPLGGARVMCGRFPSGKGYSRMAYQRTYADIWSGDPINDRRGDDWACTRNGVVYSTRPRIELAPQLPVGGLLGAALPSDAFQPIEREVLVLHPFMYLPMPWDRAADLIRQKLFAKYASNIQHQGTFMYRFVKRGSCLEMHLVDNYYWREIHNQEGIYPVRPGALAQIALGRVAQGDVQVELREAGGTLTGNGLGETLVIDCPQVVSAPRRHWVINTSRPHHSYPPPAYQHFEPLCHGWPRDFDRGPPEPVHTVPELRRYLELLTGSQGGGHLREEDGHAAMPVPVFDDRNAAGESLACVFCGKPGRVRAEGFAPECDGCAEEENTEALFLDD